MNLSLILASTVVAAIVSGIFALYQNYRNNKMQKIIDERKAWRDDVRKIAEKIVSSDDETIIVEIAKLKVKLNAYGNTDKYNDAYSRKISNQNLAKVNKSCICRIIQNIKNRKILKKERNDNIKLVKYYKNDSHIWNLIHKMEIENDYSEKNKNILIEYLSFLLKYDWERSKIEIKFDRQFMFSIFLFFCSLGSVFLLETYYSEKEKIVENTIIIFVAFIMCFLCSLIPRYDLFNKNNYDKHKASGYFIVPICVILLAIGLLTLAVFFNKTDGLYFFPFILLLVSLVLNYESFIKNINRREKYRDLLLEYDKKHLANKTK